jgi:hypothetical protein
LSSWPDLFRPSTFFACITKNVDHRDKPGDDGA